MTFADDDVSWDGPTPLNHRYDDCYFSAANGLAESELVFLNANRITERLQQQAQLVVGELGFGTGLNFLATWARRQELAAAARLTFISTEAHPLSVDALARAHHAFPQFAEFAKPLQAQWPSSSRGFHRLSFAKGAVTLLLLFGDAAESLAELEASVDAWYLDGFSPAKNPAMWSPEVFAQVSRLSAAGSTCGTWCAAGFVRRGLAEVGFEVSRQPGHGNKRHRTVATLSESRQHVKTAPWQQWPTPPRPASVAIIGAGLAGAAVAHALQQRGIPVTVYDAATKIAAGASGNLAGLVLPPLQKQPNPVSEWQLTAYFLARRQLADSPHARLVPVSLGGRRAIEPADAAALLAANGLPSNFIAWHEQGPQLPGLVVSPRDWCRQQLAEVPRELGSSVSPDDLGEEVVIDCRGNAVNFVGLRPVRGQLVELAGPPPAAHAGNCYLIPTATGAVLGATFQPDDCDLSIRLDDQQSLLNDFAAEFGSALLEQLHPVANRVGIRACSRDYLPLVGPLPDEDHWRRHYATPLRHGQKYSTLPPPAFVPGRYLSTAHGSHGIAGSLLAAELLAGHLCGDPTPIPLALRHTVSPSRFLTRELRKTP